MRKDFDKWNGEKKKVNAVGKRPFFHEREIWFCSFGVNIGFEQDGSGDDFLRPIIVVRKFNNEVFWGVPLTKSKKRISSNREQYYFSFTFVDGVVSLAILSQIKLIDARRLARRIGNITEKEFSELTKKLKALLP
ncbi:type II toxin-antitoxin system PemK/MazF family toxin [bacterium]|nr:type II toxin-antitoxin system PemK/MazF family toxin [bacterium]MCI0565894.1 type II toxin-antitoxin system PemK/MazF family toxin [bacterium]